jgi:hypothetical protein
MENYQNQNTKKDNNNKDSDIHNENDIHNNKSENKINEINQINHEIKNQNQEINEKDKINNNKNLFFKSNTFSPNKNEKKKLNIEDFEISFTLGKGSYAKVVLAKNKKTDKYFALKIIDKKFLKKVKKIYKKILIKLYYIM